MWGLLSGLLIFSIAIGNLMTSGDSRGRIIFLCFLGGNQAQQADI